MGADQVQEVQEVHSRCITPQTQVQHDGRSWESRTFLHHPIDA